jgi:hypothetical protein
VGGRHGRRGGGLIEGQCKDARRGALQDCGGIQPLHESRWHEASSCARFAASTSSAASCIARSDSSLSVATSRARASSSSASVRICCISCCTLPFASMAAVPMLRQRLGKRLTSLPSQTVVYLDIEGSKGRAIPRGPGLYAQRGRGGRRMVAYARERGRQPLRGWLPDGL